MARQLLGNNIVWESMSEQQLWILEKRAQRLSVDKILAQWKIRFPNEEGFGCSAFNTCIISCALGLNWCKGENVGSHPYLCSKDLSSLERYIEIKAEENEECPIDDVLQEAKRLKIIRNQCAITVLRLLNHYGLASKLEQIAIKAASPSWISNLSELIAVKTEQVVYIDKDRFFSCHKDVIDSYFSTYKTLIESYHPSLRFGADETMLQPQPSAVDVIPEYAQAALREGVPDIPHVTAMCCHNCTGKCCPLFIILKQLQNLPPELKEFSDQGEAWFASSNKGYMTRELFLFWVINFANWLSFERSKMEPSLRTKRALLITDGHLSRECPLAVKILDEHMIDLLVLPSHCTHVLQMFDVVLASVMKNKFSKLFKTLIKRDDFEITFRSGAAKLRYCIVHATITGWQSACTRENCLKAAKKTGTFPCNSDEPLSSPYVRTLTVKENEIYQRRLEYAQRNFVCSGKLLNNQNVFIDLTNKISQRDELKHLLSPYRVGDRIISVIDIPKYVQFWNKNGSKLFSKFHPLIKDGIIIHY